MITPWLQATAKRRSGATRRHLHMSIAVGLLAGVAGRMVAPCGIPSVLDRQWFHAEWGTLMVHLGLVPDSPGSENPTASFSSGSAVPLSYIIYLPDWTLICRSVLAHPPTDREEKKVFTVRLRVGGKAKKTWLSVNFTSGFFLWACAVHIPKRNWLEKKINNVQSRTHPHPLLLHTTGIC